MVYLVSWLRCLGGAARKYCGDPIRDGTVPLCVCVCVCVCVCAFITTELDGSQENNFTIQLSYPQIPQNRRLYALRSWSRRASEKNSVPVRNRTLVSFTVMTEVGCFKWHNSKHTAHHLASSPTTVLRDLKNRPTYFVRPEITFQLTKCDTRMLRWQRNHIRITCCTL
jgi:hypothetical protein